MLPCAPPLTGGEICLTAEPVGVRPADALDFAEAPGIGDRVRLSIIEDGERLAGSFKPEGGAGQQWDVEVTVEIENESTPALIAEILSMFIVDPNKKEQA